MPAPRAPQKSLALAALLALALAPAGCGAPRGATVRVDDPRGDDHGPGTYVYPQGPGYQRGGFDLTEVSLTESGDDVIVRARFASRVPIARGVRVTSEQVADLFLPTVDIYLDLDRGLDSGHVVGLPGRQVRFAAETAWEVAIVLSPIPGRARELLRSAAIEHDVLVPTRVEVAGDRLEARVPRALLAERPLGRIGIGAVVTGTVFHLTFQTLIHSQLPTALVREVTPQPGRCGRWEEDPDGRPCTFGGCDPCEHHPRVLDALHPERGHQERLLGRYAVGPPSERHAIVPMVYPGGDAPKPPPPPQQVVVKVIDQRGKVMTAQVEAAVAGALREGTLVEGLGRDGVPLATLTITALAGEGLIVLRLVDGRPEDVTQVRVTFRPIAAP